ncbi:hypothetical protein JB92DRAFT_2935909 [Gautieria morchelliformis]|nr:hypothetical protein JB92DRAFT_2935909 [Gautieria morchelliformis]
MRTWPVGLRQRVYGGAKLEHRQLYGDFVYIALSGACRLIRFFFRLQPWDVLIDDLCSPVSLTWDAGSIDLGQFAHQATEYDDDFYDLQYALEISRRDRRKTMSGPDSAGEYSKSRESWAILHINRVMPEDQEYWFRYWLQWHRRLEERAAFKLQKAYRKEEFNRYQSVRHRAQL